MKSFIALLLLFNMGSLQAQFTENGGTIKSGIGYTHDFPGMNGYTAALEYAFPLFEGFQGAFGAKRADLNGFPRTAQVQEYTKATTIDFNFYWLPYQREYSLIRIGLGYSFSFYNIKRAYPIIVDNGGSKTTTWPSDQSTGRTRGINLIAEYEYKIPNSLLSIGMRGALYKAYTRTYFLGPMLGFKL
jgi:hypothetical protein